jgi:hypothetical protein
VVRARITQNRGNRGICSPTSTPFSEANEFRLLMFRRCCGISRRTVNRTDG